MTDNELSARVAQIRGDEDSILAMINEWTDNGGRGRLYEHLGMSKDVYEFWAKNGCKPYATDMNMAMELKREMNKIGRITIVSFQDAAMFIFDGSSWNSFNRKKIYGYSECKAICRAYLLFKGMKIEEVEK